MAEWDPAIPSSCAGSLGTSVGMAGTAQEKGNAVHTASWGEEGGQKEKLWPGENKNRGGIMKGTRGKGGGCGANVKGWYYVDNL